jgi:hypothetical protein
MLRAMVRVLVVVSPMLILAVPVLGRAAEPAKQPIRSRYKEYEDLRKRLRDKGLIVDDEDEKAVQELQSRIQREIKSLVNHPWAGEYYCGDGLHNSYVYIAPRAGFLFIYRGDIGLPYANHGPVEQRDGRLHLSLTPPLEGDNFYWDLSKTLIPITWGERKYLVQSERLIDFCNQVNEGREPRQDVYGFSLLRRGDEKMKVTGTPVVFREVAPYLLAKPVEASIIGVGKPVTSPGKAVTKVVISVSLNRGRKAGLLPGMTLWVVSPCNVFDDVTITKVDDERSEGAITRYPLPGAWSLLSYFLDASPKIGWRLSTRSNVWSMVNTRQQKAASK